jgi:hypothetical protein
MPGCNRVEECLRADAIEMFKMPIWQPGNVLLQNIRAQSLERTGSFFDAEGYVVCQPLPASYVQLQVKGCD